MTSGKKNLNASNASGVRANISYGNILDQKRYIYALKYIKNKVVLDCACGIGWGTFLMANAGAKSVLGVDLSPNAIEAAERFYSADNLEFVKGSLGDVKSEMKFDIITSFETLEHVDNPVDFLKHLRIYLKPNGVLLLSTPNGYCFKDENDKPYNPYHLNEFKKDELLSLLVNSGWCVDDYLG